MDLINPPLYLSMLTNNKEQLGLELLVIPGVKPKAAVLVANSAEGPLGINLILQLHLCILRGGYIGGEGNKQLTGCPLLHRDASTRLLISVSA